MPSRRRNGRILCSGNARMLPANTGRALLPGVRPFRNFLRLQPMLRQPTDRLNRSPGR
jgi:hypothetical protein